MQQTRFSVDSNGSIGCTFLEWSIHWLNGQQSYYFWGENKPIELVSDPFTGINAHKHSKNHPTGAEETKKCVEIITNQTNNKLVSCYSCDMRYDYCSEYTKTPNTDENRYILDSFINEDRQHRIDFLRSSGFKLIHIFLPHRLSVYSDLPVRSLGVKTLTGVKIYSSPEYYIEDHLNTYFSESKNKYTSFKLWDFRELIALTLASKVQETDRFRKSNQYKKTLLNSFPNKIIIAEDFWCETEERIIEIMNFLELGVNQKRLIEWRTICHHWQKIQLQRLSFINNLDLIADAIVNNYAYDLCRFNLTIIHEAIIQSRLLRDYNLTIKNFELEKFPNNTQDIHKLLEENFHTIL